MSSATTPQAGVRGRTRQAILDAAPLALYRDRGATLADIARAAGVGRSTLHRYFPDRDGLLRAVMEDSCTALDRTVAEARLDEGAVLEALRRLVTAMVDVSDRLLYLFGDPQAMAEVSGEEDDASTDAIRDLVRRGQREGVLDPELSPVWVESAVWSLVYTGCELVEKGEMSRHGVTATVMRMLENGVCGPRAGD